MNASVTANVSPGTTWRATDVAFGSQRPDCVDHGDQGSGTGTASFRVTAPGTPGSYDVGFTPNEANDCKGTAGGTLTLTDGLVVSAPGPNQNPPARCGINVMLVLDKSGSIGTSGATEKVRNAARAFLASLSGTGSKVSITDFSTTAAQQVGYTTVTAASIANTFEPYLKNDYNPSGWTNWEDAFQKVAAANKAGPVADLVVFITDGDPTARNNPPGNPITGLTEGDVTAMRPAAAEADFVKEQGSHVFAVGVGAAVTRPTSARRLTAISGFDQFPGVDFSKADYTLVENFDNLEAALRAIATELCQASVTVTKVVDEGDGKYRPDPGWKFTATVSTDPGDFTWVQPSTGTGSSRSVYTGDDGVATFQWKPQDPSATSTVKLDEVVKPGYQFVDATCTNNARSKKRRRTIKRTSEPVKSITVGPNQYYKCTVRNKIKPGTIEIEKQATPQSSQKFPFVGSTPLGNFSLVDDGNGASASRIFSGLTPGTYTVSELVPDNWHLTGITCTPKSAAAITGPEATITLTPGGSVVCTYSDAKLGATKPGTIEIEKSANPQSGQKFEFSGSLGDFTLVDDGTGNSSSRIFGGLTPGTYTVREVVPDNWGLTSITCSTGSAAAITGPEVAITIAAGDAVACAYRDTRNEPPAPPEPPTPPAPPAPPSPTVGGEVVSLPSTQLRVAKRAPRVARVGQRIRFSGRVAARNVRVADFPPGAVGLASLRSGTRARVLGGEALWRLGTLAAGASRTIRGSVRIKSVTPGWKRNWVLATAVNAQLVSARADTRLLVRRPRFTG